MAEGKGESGFYDCKKRAQVQKKKNWKGGNGPTIVESSKRTTLIHPKRGVHPGLPVDDKKTARMKKKSSRREDKREKFTLGEIVMPNRTTVKRKTPGKNTNRKIMSFKRLWLER